MQRAHAYAVAVVSAATDPAQEGDVVAALVDVLKEHGELNLLPKIIREIRREIARNVTVHSNTLTLARASDEKDARDALLQSPSLRHQRVDRIVVDPRIVGGYTLGNAKQFVDESYRSKLISIFNSLV